MGYEGGGHRDVAPARVGIEAEVDIVLQCHRDAVHEWSPGGDDVAIPRAAALLLHWQSDALHSSPASPLSMHEISKKNKQQSCAKTICQSCLV